MNTVKINEWITQPALNELPPECKLKSFLTGALYSLKTKRRVNFRL